MVIILTGEPHAMLQYALTSSIQGLMTQCGYLGGKREDTPTKGHNIGKVEKISPNFFNLKRTEDQEGVRIRVNSPNELKLVLSTYAKRMRENDREDTSGNKGVNKVLSYDKEDDRYRRFIYGTDPGEVEFLRILAREMRIGVPVEMETNFVVAEVRWQNYYARLYGE